MNKKHCMRICVLFVAGVLASITLLDVPGAASCFSWPGPSANYVNLAVHRIDRPFLPQFDFRADLDVIIPDVVGVVTSVTVTTGGGMVLELEQEDSTTWFSDVLFADLTAVTTMLHGTWEIVIAAADLSTTTFTLDASLLKESDFFATTTGVCPPNDSTDVQPDVVFSWIDPTVGVKPGPDLLGVCVEGPSGIVQEDDSLTGTLTITDTSWSPPMGLEAGTNSFSVGYLRFASFVEQFLMDALLTVTSGSIKWGDSPFAPPGYPVTTPFVVLGSTTHVDFEVICKGDIHGDGTINVLDLIDLLLCFGQPAVPGCEAEDVNGDGSVNVLDLIELLLAFGTACP